MTLAIAGVLKLRTVYSVAELAPVCGVMCQPFDLLYFDGLGKQDEEFRLTVNPRPVPPLDPVECKSGDQPPIDLCIRTLWPGASVDWNGSEPLL